MKFKLEYPFEISNEEILKAFKGKYSKLKEIPEGDLQELVVAKYLEEIVDNMYFNDVIIRQV